MKTLILVLFCLNVYAQKALVGANSSYEIHVKERGSIAQYKYQQSDSSIYGNAQRVYEFETTIEDRTQIFKRGGGYEVEDLGAAMRASIGLTEEDINEEIVNSGMRIQFLLNKDGTVAVQYYSPDMFSADYIFNFQENFKIVSGDFETFMKGEGDIVLDKIMNERAKELQKTDYTYFAKSYFDFFIDTKEQNAGLNLDYQAIQSNMAIEYKQIAPERIVTSELGKRIQTIGPQLDLKLKFELINHNNEPN
jgi:hypothetical protein